MKIVTVAAVLSLAVSPAIAQPAPAGQCSFIDGGVAQVGPSMSDEGLRPVSTPLPQGIGDTVADVSFQIQSNGTVSDVKLLCVTTKGSQASEILKTIKLWKFTPVKKGENLAPSNAAYRVSTSGAIPLSFIPNPGPKKIEG